MAHAVVFSYCGVPTVPQRLTICSVSSAPWGQKYDRRFVQCFDHFTSRSSGAWTLNKRAGFVAGLSAEAGSHVETMHDEEWEERMRKETAEREAFREQERLQAKIEERKKEAGYQTILQELSGFPKEEVKHARKFVANLIKAGNAVEEMIVEAADNGELTPLVLLVVKNRLELARHDNERDAIQALDLLSRRIETEMLQREAPLALQLLDTLLNLHDGFSREEWLRRSRLTMLKVFPPEDVFTVMGSENFDLFNHRGPMKMPEEEDEVLLRIDFIREVDNLLRELETPQEINPVQGLDPQSIAMRFNQEQRIRVLEQVKELRDLAIRLKW